MRQACELTGETLQLPLGASESLLGASKLFGGRGCLSFDDVDPLARFADRLGNPPFLRPSLLGVSARLFKPGLDVLLALRERRCRCRDRLEDGRRCDREQREVESW